MRTPRLIAIILFALFVGAGAVAELVFGGFRLHNPTALVVGAVGTAINLLCIVTATLLWQRSPSAPRLAVIAGSLAIVFHAVIGLPPIRIAGHAAMIFGIVLGILLIYEGTRGSTLTAQAAEQS